MGFMGSQLHNHTSGVQSNRVFTSKVRIFRFKNGSVNYVLRLTKRKSRPGMRDRDKDPVTRKHARPVKGGRESARAQRKKERGWSTHRCCWVGDLPQNERSGVETGIQVGRSAAPNPILHGLPLTRSILLILTDIDELPIRAARMTNMQHHP